MPSQDNVVTLESSQRSPGTPLWPEIYAGVLGRPLTEQEQALLSRCDWGSAILDQLSCSLAGCSVLLVHRIAEKAEARDGFDYDREAPLWETLEALGNTVERLEVTINEVLTMVQDMSSGDPEACSAWQRELVNKLIAILATYDEKKAA